ncbi:TPA: tRNA (adenosine(37)-N6)-dimethylallyltransferase MiaA [Candidatus Avigastranaerophilus faecigallinarum]|nr:tRNA (adenosine(37)-N6)-dimethylallyltransferase MiaA [Candidatus Avigastranaerophilus faecigallinarum]
MTKQKIIAITGPSASGKTKLSIELAKKIDGEIISVDSRQIYKELDIGSAKPTLKEQDGIPHYLMDIIDLNQEYTVANFCDDANIKIKEIINKGKVPILVGGTGLYFRVLLQDFDLPRVEPNKELREELEQKSSEELFSLLKEKDPDIAEKIHFNNKVKIIRALEVCLTLGIPMSKAQKKKESEYNVLWFGLNAQNREFLYGRINKRVDIMFEQGLIDEAKKLFDKYGENKILLGTIGYQELFPYLKGETDFETASNLLKQNTRRYAKRQISWFNANKDIYWFDIEKESLSNMLEYITNCY